MQTRFTQSRNEIGGSDGQAACDGLKNVVTRLAYQWRPATGTESFEIVRRRLFEPITTKSLLKNQATPAKIGQPHAP